MNVLVDVVYIGAMDGELDICQVRRRKIQDVLMTVHPFVLARITGAEIKPPSENISDFLHVTWESTLKSSSLGLARRLPVSKVVWSSCKSMECILPGLSYW